MAPSTRPFTAVVLAASIAVLGTALLSQYWGGLNPCELCLLQRWPWDTAIALTALGFVLNSRRLLPWLALLLAAVFIVGIGLALYHVGVEQHWVAGPSACTAPATKAQTIEELKRQILAQQVVMCDQVQWSLFGVSMAGWNALASLVMASYCLFTFRRTRVPL